MNLNTDHDALMELFLRTRGLSSQEQEEVLGTGRDDLRECVRELLRHDRAPHPLLAEGAGPAESAWSPDRIGPYLVVRRVGEGGMGVVFEVIHESTRERFALKALLPGRMSRSALQRFEHEARALARLEHPNIARIHHVGAALEGRLPIPFLVMEFIDGCTPTRRVEINRFDRRRVLELMAAVCDGVQHLHQKGIIHRDLKPSNILVDSSGWPKILDFGIARLVDDPEAAGATLTGEVLGTPPYLSPEQARGDWRAVDTRSDVYSLGIILLEMLSGSRPEAPAGRGPIIPRALKGDAEEVILKAVRARLEDRYASAGELGEEIRRLARGEPVRARRVSGLTRALRFVRRRKWWSLAGAAVLGVCVLAGEQTHRAAENMRTVVDMIHYYESDGGGEALSAEQYRALVRRVDALDLGGGLDEALVLRKLGAIGTLTGVDGWALSVRVLRRALEICDRRLGPSARQTQRTRVELSRGLLAAMRFEEAEAEARRVIDLCPGSGLDAQFRAAAEEVLGHALLHRGEYEQCLELTGPMVVENAEAPAVGHYLRGYALWELGRPKEAYTCWKSALDGVSCVSKAEPQFSSLTMVVGRAGLQAVGNPDESARCFLAINGRGENDGVAGQVAAEARASLAGIEWARGRFDLALAMLRTERARDVDMEARDPIAFLERRNMYGVCLRDAGFLDEALPELTSVLAERLRVFGSWAPSVANSRINLAKLMLLRDRPEEALPLARDALSSRERLVTPGAPEHLEAMAVYGQTLVACGETDAGLKLTARAVELRERGHADNWIADLAVESHAQSLRLAGRGKEAEELLHREAARALRDLGPGHLVTIRAANRLARFTRPASSTPGVSPTGAAAVDPLRE